MPRITLTQTFVDSAECACPEGRKSYEHNDTQVVGLYVGVTAKGTKTYYFSANHALGKRRHLKIGRVSDLTLKEARKIAQQYRSEIARGDDPFEKLQAAKSTPTWNEFFVDSYLPHAKQNKRTWKNDADMHRLRLKERFGETPINRITRQEIQQFHDDLRAQGLSGATADHHLKLVRHALNLAVDWGILEKNPAAKVKQFNEDNQVERYLSDEELSRLLRVLRDHDNRPMACLVLWLLSTGARAGEARSANFESVDYDQRVWVVQSKASKSKRRRSVALNDIALSVLDELKASGRTTGPLFVGRKGPYQYLNKNWERICKEADLVGFRMHDLRHSHASMLVNAGHSLYEVQQVLGHSDPKVAMRYSHLSKESLQRAANSAADRIKAAMGE